MCIRNFLEGTCPANVAAVEVAISAAIVAHLACVRLSPRRSDNECYRDFSSTILTKAVPCSTLQRCLMICTTRFRSFGPGGGRRHRVRLRPLTLKGSRTLRVVRSFGWPWPTSSQSEPTVRTQASHLAAYIFLQ